MEEDERPAPPRFRNNIAGGGGRDFSSFRLAGVPELPPPTAAAPFGARYISRIFFMKNDVKSFLWFRTPDVGFAGHSFEADFRGPQDNFPPPFENVRLGQQQQQQQPNQEQQGERNSVEDEFSPLDDSLGFVSGEDAFREKLKRLRSEGDRMQQEFRVRRNIFGFLFRPQ